MPTLDGATCGLYCEVKACCELGGGGDVCGEGESIIRSICGLVATHRRGGGGGGRGGGDDIQVLQGSKQPQSICTHLSTSNCPHLGQALVC